MGLSVWSCYFNPLPNDKILDWSKLESFVDDKINVWQKQKFFLGWVENIARKEKMLVTGIFSFSHNVFKMLFLQSC